MPAPSALPKGAICANKWDRTWIGDFLVEQLQWRFDKEQEWSYEEPNALPVFKPQENKWEFPK